VIGQRVWDDVDGDGIQDAGEPGVTGVTVNLWESNAGGTPQTQVDTTTTGIDGMYQFTGTDPNKTYVVEFIAPADTIFTVKDAGSDDTKDSDANPGSGLTDLIDLDPGESNATISAGLIDTPGTVGQRVWRDLDSDGIQDAGEPGEPGVTINLWEADAGGNRQTQVDTTTSAADGTYQFTLTDLDKTYVIEFVAPAGMGFTLKDAGSDDTLDSDADPATGLTDPINLSPGGSDGTIAAGLISAVVLPPAPTCGADGEVALLSASSSGTVNALPYENEDILQFDLENLSWDIYFDGSDFGITGNLEDFTFRCDTSLIMSFDDSGVNIPGIGAVDGSDLVRFLPSATGPDTAGTFQMFFDGSDVGLDDADEDIDAISILPDGRLLMSFVGNVNFGSFSASREDLIVFTATQLGPNTSGTFELYLDASDVGLSGSNENINAVWSDEFGRLYLSTTGSFDTGSLSGDASDVFICHVGSTGESSGCTFQAYFDGSLYGFGGVDVDGFTIGPRGRDIDAVQP
jgi:hypothetical protein